MSTSVEELARQIALLHAKIEGLSTTPQLTSSSIEDGFVEEYDIDGRVMSRLGQQYDGTSGVAVLNGPTPPMASPPILQAAVGGYNVSFDGYFINADAPPMDWARTEVHESTQPIFVADSADTLVDTIESPRGGRRFVQVPDYQPRYVCFVTRSLAGKAGPQSAIMPVTARKLTAQDILDGNTGGAHIYYSADEPAGAVDGDLWYETDASSRYKVHQRDEGAWLLLTDLTAQNAIEQAVAAADAAQQAQEDALAASIKAQQGIDAAKAAQDRAEVGVANAASAAAKADGKVTSYFQISAPTGAVFGAGDLWFDTDDKNRMYRWVPGTGAGTGWVISDDQRVAQALTDADTANKAAGTAQSTANRKIETFYQTSAPADTGMTEGNLWVNTATGPDLNRLYRWSATTTPKWTSVRDTLIDAANLLAGQAKSTADSKVTVYRQSAAPTGGTYKVNGDLWLDSDDGMVYYASMTTGGWTASPDQRIADALTNASTADGKAVTAQNTANVKTTVFVQISAPSTTGRTVGDIWLDSDDNNTIYDWPTAGGWTKRLIGSTALNVTARQLGGITTYYQASQPTTGMLAGDFWIDTDDNSLWTYTAGAWKLSQDKAIQTALTNASNAQSTADGKIKLYAQTSAPTGQTAKDVGDIWLDTDDGNRQYTWDLVSGTTYAWTAKQLGIAGMTAEVGTSIGQVFVDNFGDTARWQLASSSGGGTLTTKAVSWAKTGGTVAQATGGTNQFWLHTQLIPFDPTQLYRISVRAQQLVGGSTTARFYAGVAGVAADGVTLVNATTTGDNTTSSQYYYAASGQNLAPLGTFQEFVGYIKGAAATPTNGPKPAPTAPGVMHPNVRYLRVMFITNYGGAATDVMAVDSIRLEAVSTGVVDGTNLTADAIDGKVINGVTINGGTVTGGTIQTSASTTAKRWVLKSTGANTMYGYTGDASEFASGAIVISSDASNLLMTLTGPAGSGNSGGPSLTFSCPKTGTALASANLLSSAGLSWTNDLTGAKNWAVVRPGDSSSRIHWQYFGGLVTDANGQVVVNHSAGFVPAIIVITQRAGGSTSTPLLIRPITGTFTSTQLTLQVHNTNTGAVWTGTGLGVTVFMGE